VNQNGMKSLQFNFSGFSFWLTLLALIWLLGSIGLGWVVKSVIVLAGLVVVTPLLAFIGFRWWIKRNLVVDRCPVCDYESAAINGTQLRCPSCSEPLQVEKRHFHRLTLPGTVDVTAIEVPVKQIEDN
jgi:hypothetical protein